MDRQAARSSPRGWARVLLSVRALMVLILLSGLAMGWAARRARIQRDAVAAIRRAGGSVRYDWECHLSSKLFVVFDKAGRPAWPSWIVDALGPDYFGSVRYAWLGELGPELDAVMADVGRLDRLEALHIETDETLTGVGSAHLRGLTRLQVLELGPRLWIQVTRPTTRASRAVFEDIASLRRLRRLWLYNLAFGDAEMAPLKRLSQLEVLTLENPDVTDVGLGSIGELTNLREIRLDATRLTDAGLRSLARLPNLRTIIFTVEERPGDYLKSLASRTDLDAVCWSRSKVTDAGIAALQRARPRLRIVR